MASLEWERLSTLSDEDVAHRTRQLLRSETPWRTIPGHLGEKLVQRVVDVIQQELDESFAASDNYRTSCIKCLLTFTERYSILPRSLFCQDVTKEGKHPVAYGGFADIWRGSLKQQPVCLKVLRMSTSGPTQEELLKKCSHETLLWRQLLHPNILPFIGIDRCSFAPSFCLISPWMDNGDIISFLKTHPQHDRFRSIYEIAQGLLYLHGLNPQIIHGDIKGCNILVTEDFRCCLADFGLSWIAASQGSNSQALGGTVRWQPPESMKSDLLDVNCMSARDIYSFGRTIIEIYTGEPPFPHIKGDYAVMQEVLSKQKPPRPSSPALPDEVWGLVMDCLNFEPSKRPTAQGVVSSLDWFSRPSNKTMSSNSKSTLKPSLFAKPTNRFIDEDSGMYASTSTAYVGYVGELCQRYYRNIRTHTVVTKLRYYKLRKTHILEVYASYRHGGRVFPEHTITLKACEESQKLIPRIRLAKYHTIMISTSRPAEDFETFKYSHRTAPYSRHVEMDAIHPEMSSLSFDQVVSLLDSHYASSKPHSKNILPWVVGSVAKVTIGEYSMQATEKTKVTVFNDNDMNLE